MPARRSYKGYVAGYTATNTESVDVDTTVGGTAIPTTPLSGRAYVEVYVGTGEGDTLYLSTGTPTSENHFVALTAGKQWGGYLSEHITLKGLSSSGTIAVKLLELGD